MAAARSLSTRSFALLVAALCLAASGLVVTSAQNPPPTEAPVFDIAVGPASGKKEIPADLEVFVGDQRIEPVERLSGAAAGPLRAVIYLDYSSARPGSVQALSTALVEQSERLAAIPGLQIVEADPEPQAMQRWRTREELEQDASRLALRDTDDDLIARLRGEFLSGLAELEASPDQAADADAATPRELAEEAYRAEVEHRRERQDTLLGWVAAQGRTTERRLLLLVDDNLVLDPAAFYRAHVSGADAPALASADGPSLTALSTTVAAYGWTLVPIVPDPAEAARRLTYSPSAETPVGFRLGLGRKKEGDEPTTDLGLVPTGTDAIDGAARRTGGERLADLATLTERIVAFGARPVLRFRAPQLVAGEPIPLAVRARGDEVLAPQVIAAGTPVEISALRARRAVGGESVEGGLVVRSAIEFDPELVEQTESRYEARVDLADLRARRANLTSASFRITLAVHVESGETLIKHDLVRDITLRGRDEWMREGSLRLPAETDGAVVLVELLETGDWGESFATFIRRRTSVEPAAPTAAAAADAVRGDVPDAPRPARSASMLPARRVVRLIPPDKNVVIGRSRIRVEVDGRVKRVVYLLDGKRAATRRGEPWDVHLDLGVDPKPRLLVAIAYGGNDVELGRDGLLLNDAARGFGVDIVEPRSGRRAGPVDVEASVDIPSGAALERVDFFWMDDLVSTVRSPPFRQRLFIPVAAGAGFIRVAARLTDGRTAEDVVLMNADRFEEQVTVNLVELYVVVTDRNGKPVRDLDQSDFTVLENGTPQRVESFSQAGELPITVGLALDSSLSLFLKMPQLQQAAVDFVGGLFEQRDQSFLIGFGAQPVVVNAATGDLDHVVDGIRSLEPTGNTALWEGVLLSMLQLQEIAGRKALIVFYDGDDEDEEFSFTTSLKMAEKIRVPVYLIVMNNALARTGPSGFTTKHRAERLEKMARTGGGKVYYVSTEVDLGEIFDSIREELRAHYLITYYPPPVSNEDGEGEGEGTVPNWRPIDVKVNRPGLTARTLAGYEKL